MEPITREEMYLAAAAGEYSGELPEPVTRSERYWKKIAQRIDAGGSVSPESIDAAIEDYLNSHDADIVTEAELTDALESKADSADIPDVSGFIGADVNNLTNYYDKDTIDTALAGKQAALTAGDNISIETVNGELTISATDTTYSAATTSADGLMSAADKAKLDGIAATAEVNVQANWSQTNSEADDYIQNKPDLSIYAESSAVATALSGKVDKETGKSLMSADEHTKLTGIEAGAQVNTVTGVKGNAENNYRTGEINISPANIGLGNVDNTSDANKPISTATQTALAGKAAVSHAHDDRYYTETEIDNKLGEKSNTGHTHDDRYYTEAEVDTLLSGKADGTDIPDVSSFITKAVNDLTNYYTKSETYTQTEIDNMVSAIPKFAIEVVQALPSQNISPTTVYLLTVQSGQQGNMYDEYIHVGNSWELLGTQTVDLSGYYTSAQVDALLSGLPVAGHTHDERYYTESEIDGKIQTINTAISGKAASDHTHDDRYYTETEIDNKLGGKSNTGHSHVQSDITDLDTALAGKAAVSHTHAQSDISGLSDALTGKAAANHNHSGVYAPASHTHTKSQITDLANATASAAGLMSAADKGKLDNNNAGYKVKIWEGSQNLVANSDLSTGYALTNFSALEIRYAMFSNHSASYIKTIRITRKDTELSFGEVIAVEKYEYSSGTLSLSICICGLTISGSHIYLTYPEGASSFWVFGVYGYK